MKINTNTLISRVKFLTYYYVEVGWNCCDEHMLQVTDLTQLDIDKIKENWFLFYKIYIFENRFNEDENDGTESKFPILEEFLISNVAFYDDIQDSVVATEYLENININFNKLYEIFFDSIEFTQEFNYEKMSQLRKEQQIYLISLYKQLKSLDLVDKKLICYNKY